MSDAKRYRISYRYGVIEDDGSPVFPAETSEPMVRAADYDVLKSQLAEAKEQRAADLAALTLKDETIAKANRERDTAHALRNQYAVENKRLFARQLELERSLTAVEARVESARELMIEVRGYMTAAKISHARLNDWLSTPIDAKVKP